MALGVYVGSLARYYGGDRRGLAAPEGAASLAAAVDAWRAVLSNSVGRAVGRPLSWNEGGDAPCFAGRLDWSAFGSLVLWAAYAEHPVLPRPARLPEEWDDDPALARSNAPGFRSRYSHLLRNVEIWLPAEFTFTFEGDDLESRRVMFGSVPVLAAQLQRLNDATWKVETETVARWREAVPATGDGLEAAARHAFAVLCDLADKAAAHTLPMKLDY